MNQNLHEKLSNELIKIGFACEPGKSFINYQLTVDLYANRKGRAMLFFPYGDYIFTSFDSYLTKPLDFFRDKHEKARAYVNSLYKFPRAFRWTVPNIASLFVSTNGFPEEVKKYALKQTRTLIGGEIHGVYLIDLYNLELISQGINKTPLPKMGGGTMEFKKVNPQNRMFYIIDAVADMFF